MRKNITSRANTIALPWGNPNMESFNMNMDYWKSLMSDFQPMVNNIDKQLHNAALVKPFPSKSQLNKVIKSMSGLFPTLRENFSALKGSPVTELEFKEIIDQGVKRFKHSSAVCFSGNIDLLPLTMSNLMAEGTYQLNGNVFRYTSPNSIVYDVNGKDVAKVILIVSITIEVVTFLLGLMGVAAPKVPIEGIAKTLEGKFGSKAVKKAMAELVEILNQGAASIGEKLEKILKFMKVVCDGGTFSLLIEKMFAGQNWYEIAAIILQFILQIALWLLPGGAAALIAKQAIVVINSLINLAKKAADYSKLVIIK